MRSSTTVDARDIEYRALQWNEVDALAELFERTWPLRGRSADESLKAAKLFVLHYMEPTTDALSAWLSDGTLAGVLLVRVAGGHPAFAEAGAALAELRGRIGGMPGLADDVAAIDRDFDDELVLERETGVNDTTQGELELFIVNPCVRGAGVGGTLWRKAHECLAFHGVRDYYLHTDSACDVSFYDHHGLTCVGRHTSDGWSEQQPGQQGRQGQPSQPIIGETKYLYVGQVQAR